MRSRLLALVLAAAACGGSPKSTTPPIPLPDDKPPVAETKPEEPKEPTPPAEPQGPVDIPIPPRVLEVKVVNAGKGKKAKLAVSAKAGVKMQTELALDFGTVQDAPPEDGGKVEQILPTALATVDFETIEVSDTGQTKFVLTFSAFDVKDRKDQKVDPAKLKDQLQALVGSKMSGTVDPDGQMKDASIRIEKPDQKTIAALQFLAIALQPLWPVLPADAVGPGAKWTVTSTEKLMDKFEIKKTVTYELVGKKGAITTIKGSTTITGEDQKVDTQGGPVTAGSIAGGGKHEVSITDGQLVPAMKQSLTTDFAITAPREDPKAKPVVVKMHFEVANAITPKS